MLFVTLGNYSIVTLRLADVFYQLRMERNLEKGPVFSEGSTSQTCPGPKHLRTITVIVT